MGNVLGHVGWKIKLQFLGLDAQDGYAHLVVRQLHIGYQTTLEARAQPLLEGRDGFRRFVARDDHLLPALVEGVEGVKELLLRTLLTGDELDVIDHQDIGFPVPRAKVVGSLLPDRSDEIVGELFRGDIRDLQNRRKLERTMSDGVQQMCLTKTHATVDEEWVEFSTGMFRHRYRRRVGESIRRSDDIGAKHVLWIEPVTTRRREGHLFW